MHRFYITHVTTYFDIVLNSTIFCPKNTSDFWLNNKPQFVLITFQDRHENSNLHLVTVIFCLLVLGTGLGTKKAVRFTEYYSEADYRGE